MNNKKRFLLIGLSIAAIIICCSLIFGAIGVAGLMFITNSVELDEINFDHDAILATEIPVLPTEMPFGSDADLEALFAPMWEAIEKLDDRSFYSPIDKQALADGAIEGLELIFEEQEIDMSLIEIPDNMSSPEEFSKDAGTPNELIEPFMAFWETWQKIENATFDGEVTYDDVFHSSMYSMVAAVGDYMTAFMEPHAFEQSQMSLDGEYEGIGAWVDTTTPGVVTIITPMIGSPAEAAGLLPNDRIIAVDGNTLQELEGNAMIDLVLGPAGTVVILTVERDEVAEPFDVEVTRAKIFVPSVISEMLDENIAYVQLTNFGPDTADDFQEALETMLLNEPVGIILDLRNNGGGYLSTSIEITSQFISEGAVLYERYGPEDEDVHYAIPDGLALDIPLVVLVNGGSASASEIVAGAIQDYERGLLVGTTTFGKGSVQIVSTLDNNRGAVRITIANWLTPDERLIQDIGLEPDFVVEVTQEDIDAEIDRQLEKAIELLISP